MSADKDNQDPEEKKAASTKAKQGLPEEITTAHPLTFSGLRVPDLKSPSLEPEDPESTQLKPKTPPSEK